MERLTIRAGEFEFDALSAGPEDGSLVILLHGFPQSSHEWRHQLPVAAGLAFRAVAPDLRGYSPGARPPQVAAYAVPELVGDVIDMADALGSGSFPSDPAWLGSHRRLDDRDHVPEQGRIARR